MAAVGILAALMAFMGLSGLLRRRFPLEAGGFFAPLAAACLIILALMAGGMLGILGWTWYALFIGGLAGFVWVYLIRRQRTEWLAVALMGVGVVYALWHFHGAYFTGNDTASHWGVAAKYLLRTHRFPDASARVITFHSYPMGATCWIYYLSRLSGYSPEACLASQTLLGWTALLPLMGAARKSGLVGRAIAFIAMAFLIAFNDYAYSL